MEWKREMIAEGRPGGQVGSQFPHFQLRELACSHGPSWGSHPRTYAHRHVSQHADNLPFVCTYVHISCNLRQHTSMNTDTRWYLHTKQCASAHLRHSHTLAGLTNESTDIKKHMHVHVDE